MTSRFFPVFRLPRKKIVPAWTRKPLTLRDRGRQKISSFFRRIVLWT
jgi:hypothetical protein